MCLLQEEWSRWWKVGQWHQHVSWPEDLGARPPRPSVELLRKVLRTFKKSSGVGFDSIRPRQPWELDGLALECLIDLLVAIEASALWPKFCAKVALLQKRLGGVRPIALIHVLARIQARLRRPLALSWGKANHRSFFWVCAGRSCERAVWQQTPWSDWAACKSREVGSSSGLWCSAQVLLDLLKAFEQVQHHVLLEAAVATGSPLWQLRLQVELYRMQ
eukprot:2110807-Pyramimonas_sp.AAC.1